MDVYWRCGMGKDVLNLKETNERLCYDNQILILENQSQTEFHNARGLAFDFQIVLSFISLPTPNGAGWLSFSCPPDLKFDSTSGSS